jgi:hypothetical protein
VARALTWYVLPRLATVPEASPAEDGHSAPEARRRVGGEGILAIRGREREAEEESPRGCRTTRSLRAAIARRARADATIFSSHPGDVWILGLARTRGGITWSRLGDSTLSIDPSSVNTDTGFIVAVTV